MSLPELPLPFLEFLGRAIAAAFGSFLASLYLFIRSADREVSIRTYFTSQVSIALVSGGIIAGIPGVAGRYAFPLGLIFAIAWNLIVNPFKEQLELERSRTTELKETVAKAEAAIVEQPEKAKPLWDLSRAQMELYIRRNHAQVGSIFWITVCVMAAGLSLVGYGVFRALDNQLGVAVLTATAGVVTQAIGATFLIVYRSTLEQASSYVGILERIHFVGMAVQAIELIPDANGDLKNQARLELVKQILSVPHPERRSANGTKKG